MEPALWVTEWEPVSLTQRDADEVRAAVDGLKNVLRPRLSQLDAGPGGLTTVKNLLGSVRLPSGGTLQIQPRQTARERWTESVAQLLDGDTRIAVSGSQRSSHSPNRNDLVTAVALEYSNRLAAALHRTGPIEAYRRERLLSHRLNGHLRTSRWLRTTWLKPAIFPIERDSYTTSNDFSQGLAKVAAILAVSARNATVTARLRNLERQLLPGEPPPMIVNPAIASRRMPIQWSAYQPAWDIAAAVLRNTSVVGDPGTVNGLEVAVEPWPLLETLLVRTLRAFGHLSGEYEFVPKRKYPVLTHQDPAGAGHAIHARSVEPDGLLLRNSQPLISFEAKYTTSTSPPERDHVFQALTTAAALGASLAVLVYPGDEQAMIYDVCGFSGVPRHLATIGLSMFAYTRSTGDIVRARQIAALLDELTKRSGLSTVGCQHGGASQ